MKPIRKALNSNWVKIFGVLILIVFSWHFLILLTPNINMAGPLVAQPRAGYTWKETENVDTRFFWQDLEVAWVQGTMHPEFKAETSTNEGIWLPLAGYKFTDESKDLGTVWTPGLLHPDFQAWSDTGEGLWIPATGYKFVYEGDEFVATTWDPGKRYEDLKIISLNKQDSFIPFPGYQFVEPGKTFEVVWTPGVVNSDNHRLVSGVKEGSWEVNYRRSHERDPNWLEKEIVRGVIYHAL